MIVLTPKDRQMINDLVAKVLDKTDEITTVLDNCANGFHIDESYDFGDGVISAFQRAVLCDNRDCGAANSLEWVMENTGCRKCRRPLPVGIALHRAGEKRTDAPSYSVPSAGSPNRPAFDPKTGYDKGGEDTK